MGSAWNQLEQMLTCAICLDKYKNPRLLPCQHSFCGDACMEGLVDYARRQIKCPECRAEHRIPYQGVTSLPTNVTLIRFLELHARITGDEPEPVPTFMEKCSVCGEKIEGVARCWHCDKKVCPECREAHLDVLRREVGRVNAQTKRCLGRMEEFEQSLDRWTDKFETNRRAVVREIEESCRRLVEDLQAKQARLLDEVARYAEQEHQTVDKLRAGVRHELEVLEANCRLADDKFTSNKLPWTDQELAELKAIYTRSMEFVRLFEPDLGDSTRKLRFNLLPEFETMRRRVCELGELKLAEPALSVIANSFQYCNATGPLAHELCQQAASVAAGYGPGAGGPGGGAGSATGYGLSQSNSNSNLNATLELPNALMRSQSDHRLASQFQQKLKQQQQQQQLDKSNGLGGAGAGGRYGLLSSAAKAGADYEPVDSFRSRYAPPGRASGAGAGAGARAPDPGDLLTRDWPRPSDPLDDGSPFTPSIHFKSAFMRRKEQSKRYAPNLDDDDDLASELSFSLSTPGGERNVRFYADGPQSGAQSRQAAAPPAKLFDLSEADRAPISGLPRLDNSAHLASRLHQMEARAKVDKRQLEEELRRDKDLVESARQAISRASQRPQRQPSDDEIERQKRAAKESEQQQQVADRVASVAEEPAMAELSPDDEAAADLSSAAARSDDQNSVGTVVEAAAQPDEPPTTTPAPAPVTPPSPATSTRRSLYGQAVTEKSRQQQQLSSAAAQEAAASYSARRRLTLSRDDDDQPSTSTMRPKRSLRSLGKSGSSKQSSLEAADASAPSTPTTQRRRKLLARAETSQLSGAGSPEASQHEPAKRQFQSKNLTPGSGRESEPPVGVRQDSLAAPSAPADEQPSATAEQDAAGQQRAPSDAPLSGDDDDNDHLSQSQSQSQGAASDSEPDDDAAGYAHQKASKRLSRELLPNAVNKLLDRSAQIRKDSQEQRSRADSPQRSAVPARPTQSSFYSANRPTGGAATPSSATGSTTAGSSYKPASRFNYSQRSQSIRNDNDDDSQHQQQVNNSSNNSIYTTASSSAHSSSGRKSSLELEAGESGYGRQLSGSSGERTVIASSELGSPASRYLRRDSSGDNSSTAGAGYRSRFLARSRTSAALSSSDSARSQDGPADRHQQSHESPAARSYLSSRDKFLQSANAAMSAASSGSGAGSGSTSGPASSATANLYSRTSGAHSGSDAVARSEYLRNKFAHRRGSSGSSSSLSRSRSSHLAASRDNSRDDDQHDDDDDHDDDHDYRPDSPTATDADHRSSYRRPSSNVYSGKGKMVAKLGMRGCDPGNFTWPRGVAVGSTRSASGAEIVVADSSNHRVQIFDAATRRFVLEFGSYGSAQAEFDCLAGVAINGMHKHYVVSDRYNHRIQLFDFSGRFVHSFGEQGREPGKFNLPWGVACDTNGSIYVCDKENHRIQVFDHQGVYLSKFGLGGSGAGQLLHPHYIAVGCRKIVVTDTNNHRVQVFDMNGRMIKWFGSEGSASGQFKFPRGIAMDDQGYIVVGDSGNNRLQIFNPEGQFVKSIGTWGCADGEFKGIEGVAVDSNHNILVCDRENHRIQIF